MTTPDAGQVRQTSAGFDAFLELVCDDRELRGRLREGTESGGFVERVVRAGRERGYAFDAANVEAAILSGRRRWFERRIIG